jgi:hypothetical protein
VRVSREPDPAREPPNQVASTADEPPSPAELAFIERVLQDRARARALRRRAILTGTALIAVIAAGLATLGVPRAPDGARVVSTGAPATPLRVAPTVQLSPTSDMAAAATQSLRGVPLPAPPHSERVAAVSLQGRRADSATATRGPTNASRPNRVAVPGRQVSLRGVRADRSRENVWGRSVTEAP